MDRTGLIDKITKSVLEIYLGRKWLDTDGQEREGRISFNSGLSLAMDTFREVQALASDDIELVVLCEYTFLAQELDICESADTQAVSSLTNALQSFDDAFLSLKAVADVNLYKGADMTHPNGAKYRIKGMPRDAFHVMCIAHRARINNTLRTPGINMTEKDLFAQRLANINAAQAAYLVKQQNIMDEINEDHN